MSSKSIAIIGKSGRFSGSATASLRTIFLDTGLNTGNIAFFHAVSSHVANPITYLPWFFDPGRINETCAAVVMPAANMINAFQDHGQLAKLFAKIKVPVAIVGLGSQLPLGAMASSLALKEGTVEFIRVLAGIGAHVGCRGETTRQVLADHGLDAEVVGCPSNFTNPSVDLGTQIAARYGSVSRGILAHCDFNKRLRSINEKLVGWVSEHGGMVSIQDPERGFLAAMRDEATLDDPDVIKDIAAIFGVKEEAARRFALDKLITFADWPSWTLYSRSFSVSLGTRMHGNMIAFQAGVPTVLFPHDARVDELAATMDLPRVPLDQAVQCRTVAELLDSVEFDGQRYDARRLELAARYFGLLRSAGVTIAEPYEPLAAAAAVAGGRGSREPRVVNAVA